MGKGGGVSSVDVPWQLTQAYQNLGNIAQQEQRFGEELFQYGKGRTKKYWDPVLNQALAMVTGQPGTGDFASPLNMAMTQYPLFASQQQLNATEKQIKDQTPPGPQQSALLANARNQQMQSVTSGAYQNVNNMINALSGQSNAVWQGAQGAQTGFGQAAGAYGQQAQIGGQVSQIQQQNQQLQLMAQQSGNQLLGGIFGAIGQLGGAAIGAFA